MRIDSIELIRVKVPLKEAFRAPAAKMAEKDAVLCLVEAGGATGVGECSPMSGSLYGGEAVESSLKALEGSLVPALMAEDLEGPEDFSRAASAIEGNMPAKAGLEMALWDLYGKLSGRPIYEMLGAGDDIVQSGLTVGIYDTAKALLDRIESHLVEGYVRVKVKIRPGWDGEPLSAIRKKFKGIDLMVDADGSYTMQDAADLKRLDAYSLMMIEQPFPKEALEDSASLQSMMRTPICIGEGADSLESVERAISIGACSIVDIGLQRVGGFGPAKRMHDLCRSRRTPVWCGCSPELGISTAGGLHASGLPGYLFPGDLSPSSRWFADDITAEPVAMSQPGLIPVPSGPGLGVGLDMEKVAKYELWRGKHARL